MTSVLVWSTVTDTSGPAYVPDERTYIVCGLCGYEKPVGEPCGLPCV